MGFTSVSSIRVDEILHDCSYPWVLALLCALRSTSKFPSKIQECENQQLPNLDDPEAVRLFLDARGNAFQEVMPLGMRNLAIARHRDKARFKRVRGGIGGWDRPKIEVKEGAFVVVKNQVLGGLDIATNPHILRVLRLKESGVVVLQGQDGSCEEEQVKNVAPCSLPIFTRSGSFEGRLSTVGSVGSEIKLTGWSPAIDARRDTTSGVSRTSSLRFI